MIHYALECQHGHEFDGWFGSSSAFDEQLAAGQLVCPYCNSHDVEKALMAPAVVGASLDAHDELPHSPAIYGTADETRYFAKLRAVQENLKQNAENVGERFPEVARQIHYQEIAPKSIYGHATLEDAYHLAEEGVEFVAIPSVPDALN